MSLSVDHFKDFFRHHGAGVSAITTFGPGGEPFGFTASSLASLSAQPAFATVNLAKSSSTAAVLEVGSKIAVHALSSENQAIAAALAGPRESRFQSPSWDLSGIAPLNKSASAIIIGEVAEIYPVAESLILVIGCQEVISGEFPQKPLIYFNREYLK